MTHICQRLQILMNELMNRGACQTLLVDNWSTFYHHYTIPTFLLNRMFWLKVIFTPTGHSIDTHKPTTNTRQTPTWPINGTC